MYPSLKNTRKRTLPPAFANKTAAWQRQKTDEDTTSLQKQNESIARATAGAVVTLPGDSGRSPAANVLHPSLVQSDANEVKHSIKRNRGALEAVSDDGDD